MPTLHRGDSPLGALGPWEPAQRYWRGNEPELDLVARSVDGKRLLVGEAKWPVASRATGGPPFADLSRLPGVERHEVIRAHFTQHTTRRKRGDVHLVDAETVLAALD